MSVISEDILRLKELVEKNAKLTKVFEKDDGLLLEFFYRERNDDGEYVIDTTVLVEVESKGDYDHHWFALAVYE